MNETHSDQSGSTQARTIAVLRELLDEQRQLGRFLRDDASRRRALVEQSIQLQHRAMQRVRLMSWIVLPLLLACIVLLEGLLIRFPGLWVGS